MAKELTDKLHLIKKRMLHMHQRVKHLKVNICLHKSYVKVMTNSLSLGLQKRSESLLKHRDKELNVLRQKQMQEEDLIAKPNLN